MSVNSQWSPEEEKGGCGGKDLQKKKVLSLEWKSEGVMKAHTCSWCTAQVARRAARWSTTTSTATRRRRAGRRTAAVDRPGRRSRHGPRRGHAPTWTSPSSASTRASSASTSARRTTSSPPAVNTRDSYYAGRVCSGKCKATAWCPSVRLSVPFLPRDAMHPRY